MAQQMFPDDENARGVLSEIDGEVLRRRVERELNDIRSEIDDARANGQLQRALSLCRRYLEVHPEDVGVSNVAAEIEATVNEKQVEELAEQARAYAQTGDLELVEKIAARIRRMAPSSPRGGRAAGARRRAGRAPAGRGADAAGAGAHRRGQPRRGAGRRRGGPEARSRRRTRARDPQPHGRGGRPPGQGQERAGRDACRSCGRSPAAARPAALLRLRLRLHLRPPFLAGDEAGRGRGRRTRGGARDPAARRPGCAGPAARRPRRPRPARPSARAPAGGRGPRHPGDGIRRPPPPPSPAAPPPPPPAAAAPASGEPSRSRPLPEGVPADAEARACWRPRAGCCGTARP